MKNKKKQLTESELKKIDSDIQKIRDINIKLKKLLKLKGYDKSK